MIPDRAGDEQNLLQLIKPEIPGAPAGFVEH